MLDKSRTVRGKIVLRAGGKPVKHIRAPLRGMKNVRKRRLPLGEVVIGSMRLLGKGKAVVYDLNALFGLKEDSVS